MRLLQKGEVAKQRSDERRVEVEEGAKLAKKVDELRETLSKEQLNLAKFRAETMAKIQDEISVITEERNSLKIQVNVLNEQRKELMKPLNEKWDEVRAYENKLGEIKSELQAKERVLNIKDAVLSEKMKELTLLESKMWIVRGRAETALADVTEKLKKADALLESRQKDYKEIQDFSTHKEQELASREAGIASQERNNDLRSTYLDSRERELNTKEAQISDREKTLSRTEKRHGKSNT